MFSKYVILIVCFEYVVRYFNSKLYNIVIILFWFPFIVEYVFKYIFIYLLCVLNIFFAYRNSKL